MTDRPLEIERKFLVPTLPDLQGIAPVAIRQGYITQAQDMTEVRLRQAGQEYFLSIKGGEGLVRSEREVRITAAQFDALWPETGGRRIEKSRYKSQLPGGNIFELDIYAGALDSLLTVEVEFASETEANAFAPPDWFGTDVTTDRRYRNKALASIDPDALKAILP